MQRQNRTVVGGECAKTQAGGECLFLYSYNKTTNIDPASASRGKKQEALRETSMDVPGLLPRRGVKHLIKHTIGREVRQTRVRSFRPQCDLLQLFTSLRRRRPSWLKMPSTQCRCVDELEMPPPVRTPVHPARPVNRRARANSSI